MNRATFLERLLQGAAAVDHEMHRTLDSLAFPTLRYHLPQAQLCRLLDTGDARRWLVQLKGRSGRWVSKEVILSGAVITVGSRSGIHSTTSETAYQICKRAKECARDLAHMEGIDWRWNEHTWPEEWHRYDAHLGRFDRA